MIKVRKAIDQDQSGIRNVNNFAINSLRKIYYPNKKAFDEFSESNIFESLTDVTMQKTL